MCSEDFIFYIQEGNLTSKFSKVPVSDIEVGMKVLRVPNCPISEGGTEEFPFAYSHGFYSGAERYWRERRKVSRASIRGVRHAVLPYLDLDHEATTKTSLVFDERIPADFEVPLDPKYSVETKLDWLAGVFDSGLMKRKIYPHPIWHLHSDNVDFLYQVKLLLQTLGADSRHISNVDHRFQQYSLRLRAKSAEVLMDLGVPTLVRKFERVKNFGVIGSQASMSAPIVSIEDAFRSSDIYNFSHTTKQSTILNGIFTASN